MKTKTLKILLAAITVVSLSLAIYCLVVRYQGNRKQLGIARRSRTDCTWELHQYIFFEEVQRQGGIRWALSLMNQRCIPAISVGSSGRWKRCTNLGTGE